MRGSRLSLREWEISDAPALESACADTAITDFTSVPTEYSPDSSREWIERQHAKRTRGEVLSLAAIMHREELPVGNVSLVWSERNPRSPALGYWLLPEARGKNLAAEAVSLMTDWAFASLNIEAIELAIDSQNTASIRVAESVGARRDGATVTRENRSGVLMTFDRFELMPAT